MFLVSCALPYTVSLSVCAGWILMLLLLAGEFMVNGQIINLWYQDPTTIL